MKPLLILSPILMTAALSLASAAASAQAVTCDTKRDAINHDIDEARAKGQKQRVRGLEKALDEVKNHCSEASLKAEHQRRISAQEKKVAKDQRDLQAAERKGDPEKIASRKAKLAQAQAELQKLKDAP